MNTPNARKVAPSISLSQLRDDSRLSFDADEIELISKDGDLGTRRDRAISGVSLATTNSSFRNSSLNPHHLSLASDTTRVASVATDPRDSRHFSKQSLLSTSHLIAEDNPHDRAVNHASKLWTRKCTFVTFLHLEGLSLCLFSRHFKSVRQLNSLSS
jgi:hypothetical protein